jgi:UDP-N-acetylglucosamine:LPS N-acetylglucosamine transferase
VAGHERALEGRLRRLAAGRENRIKVFGFVDHVRELMAAADFLVTKAGGLTLAEAMAAELPIICFGSLPGQEARNERFTAMTGVGLVAGSGDQLQRVIAAALRDPVLLRDIRERIKLSAQALPRPSSISCSATSAGARARIVNAAVRLWRGRRSGRFAWAPSADAGGVWRGPRTGRGSLT